MNDKERKILIVLILILLILDQILKIVFLTTGAIIGDISNWSLGIIESEKSENNIQYILISIISVMALIRYITRNNSFIKINSKVIISFAISGVISNLIDRIWSQRVINYINIPKFASINLGYIYVIITWIGMAAILTMYTRERIKEKMKG